MSNDKKESGNTPRPMVLPDGTVFKPFGVTISKAPPPITPVSGRGISPAPRPAPTTHKPAVPVDWSFWPASRRVKRDEAIALSLGLDPHSLYSSTDGHINPESCPDDATAILFLKRLNLLAASDSRTNILLSEFAAWAVSISLAPIPPELEAIVSTTKSNEARERAVDKVTDAMMARNKPVEKVFYIIQGAAPHAPATPNATKTDGISAPVKVGDGDTAPKKDAKPKQEIGEPFLQSKSRNSRAEVDQWVKWQAHQKVKATDNTSDLAERILAIADSWGYQSERGPMTIGSITKMLPTGLTGGRAKNKGIRGKNQKT